jgi:hypothetical protein
MRKEALIAAFGLLGTVSWLMSTPARLGAG